MLKNYQFQRTDEHGAIQNCFVSIRKQIADYNAQLFEVYFTNYESATEKQAASAPRPDFLLRLQGAAFLEKAMQPITNKEVGLPFLFLFSTRIWEIAHATKFIEDYSERDENGKRVCILKSLSELEAVESE